jgi:small subunit ribosomal protein S1
MTTEETNIPSAQVAASTGSDAGPDLSFEAPASPAPAATEESSPEPSQAEVATGAEAASVDRPAADVTAAEQVATSDNSQEDSAASKGSAEGDPAETIAADGELKKKRKRRKKKKKEGDHGEHRSHERIPFHMGEEVFGKVTAVLEHAIMVDLSGKALAVLDRGEMEADDLVPEVGDRFVAQVLGDGSRGGLVVLTRKPLREEEAKPKAEQAAKEGTLVNALVTGVIKGGIEVIYEGLRAFAPASGVDLHPRTANFQNLVGQVLDFKVTSYEKQGREVILSRRPMLEKEAHERRKMARDVLKEDAEMQGVVRTVVEWGAFIALPEAENLEGLIHVSELSHNPRDRVSDVLKPGQKLKVKIQKIDEKGKIWLSRKALIEDPFGALISGIKVGDEIEGEITRVEDFGAFVKISEGFEGLCHAADLAVDRVTDARELVKPGQKMQMVVHHIDPKQRRVALHPALSGDQADEPRQKVTRGAKIKIEIAKIEKPGLVVRVLGATGRQARGFIPAGQTGTPRGAELRKHFNKGDKVDALVTDIDPRRGEAKLSLSRLAQDEEQRAHKEYRAKVKAEANFGTLGDLLKQKLGG